MNPTTSYPSTTFARYFWMTAWPAASAPTITVRLPNRRLRLIAGDHRSIFDAIRQPGRSARFSAPEISTTILLNAYCLKKNVRADRMIYPTTTAPAVRFDESFRLEYTPKALSVET